MVVAAAPIPKKPVDPAKAQADRDAAERRQQRLASDVGPPLPWRMSCTARRNVVNVVEWMVLTCSFAMWWFSFRGAVAVDRTTGSFFFFV